VTMSEPPLPTRLRSILARRPKSEQDVEMYVADLDEVIRAIEAAQMAAQREWRRRQRQ
jgi:hypothetical protein